MAGCQAVPVALVSFLSALAGHTVVFSLSLASVKPYSCSSSQCSPKPWGKCTFFRFSSESYGKAEISCVVGQKLLFL